MDTQPVLVSHLLCPYVQRVAITLMEKGVLFERRYIDLANKPAWFTALSPTGETPMLLVGADALFESSVICEYLEDVHAPALHPAAPAERARHRAWMAFASTTLNLIGGFYAAPDEQSLTAAAKKIRDKFDRLEEAFGDGPYFGGDRFCLVDACFGPVFRYFDVFDGIDSFGCLPPHGRVAAWRERLSTRPSVQNAVTSDYPELLRAFLRKKDSALARRMAKVSRPAPER